MSNKILLQPLTNFYSKKNNLDKLLIILNNKKYNITKDTKNKKDNKDKKNKKISLRLIDWFVTNYCKKYKISIQIESNNKTEYVNIYDSYKSNLKAFSKQIFDPFRRKNRIILNYKEINKSYKITFSNNINKKDNYIDTTIGQLNFFKWIIENNIFTYIYNNKSKIENDMVKSQKENNNKKLDKKNLIIKVVKTEDGKEKIITRKKRNELSKCKSKNINLTKGTRVIYFNN